jgi:DNA-binding response OmpR family regulator
MIANIVVIEPEKAFRNYLEKTLIQEGYKVIPFTYAVEFMEVMDNKKFDLVICTYHLTKITPETFYKQFSQDYPETPVIFVCQDDNNEKIIDLVAYENVDFMMLPVSELEINARVRVALAPIKTNTVDEEELVIKNVTLNTKTLRVLKDDELIILSPTEFKLLHYLMQNRDRVLSRDMILSKVWGTTSDVTDRIVDVYVGYLRDKIDDKSDKKLIETVPGFGYRITE